MKYLTELLFSLNYKTHRIIIIIYMKKNSFETYLLNSMLLKI